MTAVGPARNAAAVHWDDVYVAKGESGVSWHQELPLPSLEALDRAGVPAEASVVDVGAGASTFVDSLLERGHRDVTVLDMSDQGLSLGRARLAERADQVSWRCQDVLTWAPERTFDVWHDRAAFHFLTTAGDRERYRSVMSRATHAGSVVIMATFAADGPEQCSGLPVCRYSDADLLGEMPPYFALIEAWRQEHLTPWRAMQPFTWVVARRGS